VKISGHQVISGIGLAGVLASGAVCAAENSPGILLFGSAQQLLASNQGVLAGTEKPGQQPVPEEIQSFESLRSKNSDKDAEGRYSLFGYRGDRNSFLVPLYKEQVQTRKEKHRLLDGWGLKWQHTLEDGDSFALSAHRSDNLYHEAEDITGSSSSTMASFSWTSRWQGGYRPSLTGSVFIGDETGEATDVAESVTEFGRRYYGISVGGEMTLFQSHTPYVSLKFQKNQYNEDALGADSGLNSVDTSHVLDSGIDPLAGAEMFSRLSAGWNWRIRSNWSVTAEANYIMENNEYNGNVDQGQIYFGTRFDFR